MGLKSLTVILSSDPFLHDFTVEKMVEAFGVEKKVYFADEISAEEIVESSASRSLFGRGKTLKVVRHTENWKPKEFNLLKAHAKSLANPVVLLFQGRSLPKGVEFEDDENTWVLIFNEYRIDTVLKWAKRKMRRMGISIEERLEQRLFSVLPTRLGDITNELEKLKILVGDREVEEKDLDVVSFSERVNFFVLLDHLLMGNREEALELSLDVSKDPHIGILLVTIYFKTLMQLWALRTGDEELLKLYPTPQWKRRVFGTIAKYLTKEELEENLKSLLLWDSKMKTGYQSSVANVLISLKMRYPLRW